MRKGWIAIPGVQDGDRTLAEQVYALAPALAECKGKTVIDFGCAEALIAREFIRAGAVSALCYEKYEDHLVIAREQCANLPIKFVQADLNEVAPVLNVQADIVLCLGIAHKLLDPAQAIILAARSARSLVLIRSGLREDENGIITAKHHGATCDSRALMRAYGFEIERVEVGPPIHSERVTYWRRRK